MLLPFYRNSIFRDRLHFPLEAGGEVRGKEGGLERLRGGGGEAVSINIFGDKAAHLHSLASSFGHPHAYSVKQNILNLC